MLNEAYENKAEQLQSEIDRLESEHTEQRTIAESAQAGLGTAQNGTRLRDRQWWLLWLGGDRMAYERIRPLRKQLRRSSGRAERIRSQLDAKETEIFELVHKGLKRHDPGYQAILKRIDDAARARESCARMLGLVTTARQHVDDALSSPAPRWRSDTTSGSTADQDAAELAKSISAVRNHAADVNRKTRSYGDFDVRNVKRLATDFTGKRANFTTSVSRLTATERLLRAIYTNVDSLIERIVERAKVAEGERQQYRDDERARFNGT